MHARGKINVTPQYSTPQNATPINDENSLEPMLHCKYNLVVNVMIANLTPLKSI
jgi:hypothetical protein